MAGRDEKRDAKRFQVKLERVRLSYPKIWRAEGFRGGRRGSDEGTGEKAYSATGLLDKDNPDHVKIYEELKDVIADAMDEEFNGKPPRLKADKYCLQDGDDDDDPADGYANHWFLRARNKNRPKIIDVDGSTPLVEDDGKPYGGCIVNMWVRIWVQNNDYGQRVNASLEAIQFIKDGEAFGAAPISDDEFKDERDSSDRGSRSRRGGGDDDRGGRDRDRNRDDDRDSRRSRDRDEDRGGRDRDDERRGSRDRDRDDDRRGSRDRDRDDDRGSRDRDRDRDEDRGSRSRDRDRDRDDDRGSRDRDRDRDRDEDRGSSRRRSY